jgi:glucose/arabinose dehydrogenase
LWTPLVTPVSASTLPPGFSDLVVASGLSKPTAFDFAPDGRLFVAEQRGVVLTFDDLSDTTPTVFADLRTEVYHYFDRGLLGLVVDPAFPERPYVYVHYVVDAPVGGEPPTYGTPLTDSDPCPDDASCVASLRVSRLRADPEQLDTMAGETVLVDGVCEQFAFHDGGGMAVDDTGALYVSIGDSAYPLDVGSAGVPPNPCGDPPTRAGEAPVLPGAEGGVLRSQDLRTTGDPAGLSGSLVRVDPDTGGAADGNASTGSSDPNAARVVAYGLRNPFRLAVRPGTEEVWVGDVGAGTWEEIDRVVAPGAPVENFGWPCYEGAPRYAAMDALDASLCENLYAEGGAVSAPHFAYAHGGAVVPGETCGSGNSAITGLAFYEQGGYPSQYAGALFFADVYRGCIWVMHAGEDGVPSPSSVEPFMTGVVTPVDLRTGPGGDLYYASVATGTVRRIHFDPSNQPPVAAVRADVAAGDAPLTVTFDASGSRDSDPGDTLTYAWDLNDDDAFDDATGVSAQQTFESRGTHRARVKVTDAAGASTVEATSVTVGSTPEPVITAPDPAQSWSVGDTIEFAGRATDPDAGELPASALSWSLVLMHCYAVGDCHGHSVRDFEGTDAGSFVAPDHPWPVHLQLELTAVNADGVAATTSVPLHPRTVDVGIESRPTGLVVAAGTDVRATPFTTTVVAGSRLSLSAVSPQVLDHATHEFAAWDHGGPPQQQIVAGAPATFTANYDRLSAPPTAHAGADVTVEDGQQFTLDGTLSTDPDGGPLQYAWTQVAGNAVVIHDDRSARAFVEGAEGPATLTFQVTVTDDSGQTHTDTVVVTVRAPK